MVFCLQNSSDLLQEKISNFTHLFVIAGFEYQCVKSFNHIINALFGGEDTLSFISKDLVKDTVLQGQHENIKCNIHSLMKNSYLATPEPAG